MFLHPVHLFEGVNAKDGKYTRSRVRICRFYFVDEIKYQTYNLCHNSECMLLKSLVNSVLPSVL